MAPKVQLHVAAVLLVMTRKRPDKMKLVEQEVSLNKKNLISEMEFGFRKDTGLSSFFPCVKQYSCISRDVRNTLVRVEHLTKFVFLQVNFLPAATNFLLEINFGSSKSALLQVVSNTARMIVYEVLRC